MPYSLFRKNNKWQIRNKRTGKIVGKSDTKEKAEASIRARLAGEYRTRQKY